jgi:hypothetical protein
MWAICMHLPVLTFTGDLKNAGYEVFEPIGLDGFGIHSENYALKIGRHPMDHAGITEKNFYSQLHKIRRCLIGPVRWKHMIQIIIDGHSGCLFRCLREV